MPPTVIVTEGSAPAPLEYLRQHCRVLELKYNDPAFLAALPDADGLVVRTYTKVNQDLLAKAPRLKVVGRGGVGLENIDVPTCRARGVEVVYTPDANTLAVGDFVFGAVLRLIRPWAEFAGEPIAPAEFKRRRDTLRGRQLDELTLGVLGMGRVGRRVGRIATHGFGMTVLFHDIDPAVDAQLTFPATRVSPDRLYADSDILTIHTDMREGNHHLVGKAQIAAMKKGAVLINHARGELLDAHACAEALKSGHLAAAAIDVFDPEPPAADNPLLSAPNTLLTPHMAARTSTAIDNMSWVTRDIVRVLTGQPPKYPAPKA